MQMVVLMIAKLIIGLISLLFVVRVIGRKALADVTPFDLVYTLVLGGILEESIYDDQVYPWHLLIALALWATMVYAVERITQRHEKINRVVKGEPIVLMINGKLHLKNIKNSKLEMEQLRSMARKNGSFCLKNVSHIVLESAGQFNIMRKSDESDSLSLLLIDEGRLNTRVLKRNNISPDWVKEEVHKQGYGDVEEVVYAEWAEGWDQPYLIGYQDTIDSEISIDG